jgi:hypothetical protein
MPIRIRIPPIVGVPDFFKWLFGPSSLSVCPTFSFLKNGIITGPSMTLIAKAIATDIITV